MLNDSKPSEPILESSIMAYQTMQNWFLSKITIEKQHRICEYHLNIEIYIYQCIALDFDASQHVLDLSEWCKKVFFIGTEYWVWYNYNILSTAHERISTSQLLCHVVIILSHLHSICYNLQMLIQTILMSSACHISSFLHHQHTHPSTQVLPREL